MADELRSLLIPAAADRLGVSRRTIYKYVKEGKLRTIRVGRTQRIVLDSILALQRQAVEARQEALDELDQRVKANRAAQGLR